MVVKFLPVPEPAGVVSAESLAWATVGKLFFNGSRNRSGRPTVKHLKGDWSGAATNKR